MAEQMIQPWMAVNEMMDDEYRQKVVQVALRHWPKATNELRQHADMYLSFISVPGFRSLKKAPIHVALPHVVKAFKKRQPVASAVICLWAEAQSEVIARMREKAQEAGISFMDEWTWEDGQIGYYEYPAMPEFNQVMEEFVAEKEKLEHDNLMLATLWLSRAVIRQEDAGREEEVATQVEKTHEIEVGESTAVSGNGKGPLEEMADTTPEPELAASKTGEQLETDAAKQEEQTGAAQPSSAASPAQVGSLSGNLPDLGQENLDAVRKKWEAELKTTAQLRSSTANKVIDLNTAIDEDNLQKARLRMEDAQNCLAEWDGQSLAFDRFSFAVLTRLRKEYDLRPDLTKPDLIAGDLIKPDTHWSLSLYEEGRKSLIAIQQYEKKKAALANKLDMLREEIAKVQQALLIWEAEPVENGPFFTELEETEEVTLVELERIFNQAKAVLQALNDRYNQYRDLCMNRIRAVLEKLLDLFPETEVSSTVFGERSLTSLSEAELVSWSDEDLKALEEKLQTVLIELGPKFQPGQSADFAAQLKNDWDEDILIDLHKCLAAEKREAEAFLLELSAVKVHPRSYPLTYPNAVIKSLLNGVGLIASKTRPFELLGWIAPSFLSSFRGKDPQSQAEICMIALAANLSADHAQPPGYLWQVSPDWPVEEMSSWSKLWQNVLSEEPLQIFTDQKEAALAAALASCRKEAEQNLERDGGHFVRLSSLRSNRHRSLLGSVLLPELQDKLTQLKKLESNLNESEPERLPWMVARLQSILNENISPDLQEEALTKRYESGVYEEGIEETEPYHRKISLRILQDCAAGILNYGTALLEYWELKDARSSGLKRGELQDELAKIPGLITLGQAALETISQSYTKDRVAWNENYANRESLLHVIAEVLSQSSCIFRLPRLVGEIVNQSVDWEHILEEILDDISEPLEPEAAADYLLNSNAPNQALMLVQYLPLEKQKRAQEMQGDFERQVNKLQSELLKAGGSLDGISTWHKLGRWGFLISKISEDIAIMQALQESREREIAEKSFEFRRRINELDMELFKLKSSLSHKIYELITEGITAARRASEIENLFPKVEDFLHEMDYRLEHYSWQQDGLQTMVNDLEKELTQTVDPPKVQLPAEQILKHLEAGELAELNLSLENISSTEINTRIDLLQNWFLVKQFNSLASKDLPLFGVAAIQNLFRYFAQMTAMKKFWTELGMEMTFTAPLVYEYWQLKFPRTAALDNQCIFIALPGDPPSIKDIKLLEEFLLDKEFLEEYFVFLFVPGCDEKVTRRLQGMGSGKGLVLIDEPVLTQMILAEAEGGIPLGRLRPMMLDAINANTNIFTVNQSVDARTAIFLGRDSLIKQIVNSGGSYPIYGGRRIGKSSLLKAIEQRLQKKAQVVSYTLEGSVDLSDEAVTRQLAEEIGISVVASDGFEFKNALFAHMDEQPDKSVIILLDEIDRYIQINQERHTMIETLRAASDRYGNRFRVIIAGFMELFDCLSGRGPYSQTSDPWRRMLDNDGPLGNLTPVSAEAIVKEGFLSILGWQFENRAIPQLIVERTGGHPAFVQEFCLKIFEQVRSRGDRTVRIQDVDAVFDDDDPEYSFIAYVRKTLEMNLDVVGRYLVVMLAARPEESMGFTWDEIREIAEASSPPIPEERLKRSLEYLSVTSVVHEKANQVFEYAVPDYPNILRRLGDTSHLEELEADLKKELSEA